jgi:hypothetical protein
MIRLLADENFDGRVVRELRRRIVGLDCVRAQDVGLSGMADPDVLAWAARESRVLLTHDLRTMERFAYERMARDEIMCGVILVPRSVAIGVVIDELALIVENDAIEDWDGRVRRLPL